MRLVLTWIGLLALLALTASSSYVPMGPWNSAINFGVSCAKAALIGAFFMNLRGAGALLRLVAFVALAWLGLLFGLSSTDFATRTISHAPWSDPS